MKPRLLVLTSTFPRWHNDTDPPFVYALSSRLTNTFEVTIHTPHYPGAKSREAMEGMRVHRFRYFFSPLEKLAGSTGILPTLRQNRLYYGMVPFFLLAQFCSLFILVKKYRPDVIHAHWLIPQGFLAVIVGKLTNTPIVTTAHGADIFGLKGEIFGLIKRFTLNRVTTVTVVSKALAESISFLTASLFNVHIISMGVDSHIFFPDKKKRNALQNRFGIAENCLLYVGRLTEKKGVCYLIDALSLVLQDDPDVKLLVIGSGELEGKLKAQVRFLNLSENVYFVGSVPNTELPSYYAGADIFIGPSIIAEGGDTEGFGLTFVEASMSGCLVIGTKTGGISDIIQDGETGFLVPQKNAQALAEKILFALNHEERVRKIKKAARQRCMERFDWSVIAGEYEQLLLNAITQKVKS